MLTSVMSVAAHTLSTFQILLLFSHHTISSAVKTHFTLQELNSRHI